MKVPYSESRFYKWRKAHPEMVGEQKRRQRERDNNPDHLATSDKPRITLMGAFVLYQSLVQDDLGRSGCAHGHNLQDLWDGMRCKDCYAEFMMLTAGPGEASSYTEFARLNGVYGPGRIEEEEEEEVTIENTNTFSEYR